MAGAGSEAAAVVLPRPVARRRRRQPSRRRYRVEFSLGEEEFAELCAAAGAAGLALGAYAARASLGAARGGDGGGGGPLLRDALTALVRCEGQVRKIGVNLNQAVARLNATGQGGGDLVPYAAAIIRIADRLEEWARQVRRAAIR